MPFYLAWVYGKGQTFLENLHPNSLPLHMVVLENTTLFFGQFRKGNISPWDRCGPYLGYLQCLKKQTGQGISKSKVTKSLRAHKNVRSDFWGLKWKQSIFSLINSIVLATMHANLAILRATAAMQKGGEIDEIALSIYYAPSSAHPVCFFKHCALLWLFLQSKHLHYTEWFHWFAEICGRIWRWQSDVLPYIFFG